MRNVRVVFHFTMFFLLWLLNWRRANDETSTNRNRIENINHVWLSGEKEKTRAATINIINIWIFDKYLQKILRTVRRMYAHTYEQSSADAQPAVFISFSIFRLAIIFATFRLRYSFQLNGKINKSILNVRENRKIHFFSDDFLFHKYSTFRDSFCVSAPQKINQTRNKTTGGNNLKLASEIEMSKTIANGFFFRLLFSSQHFHANEFTEFESNFWFHNSSCSFNFPVLGSAEKGTIESIFSFEFCWTFTWSKREKKIFSFIRSIRGRNFHKINNSMKLNVGMKSIELLSYFSFHNFIKLLTQIVIETFSAKHSKFHVDRISHGWNAHDFSCLFAYLK